MIFLYPDLFSGGSADWVAAQEKTKYIFTVELRDRGKYGFLLPEDQVLETGRELWSGVKVIAQQVLYEKTNSASRSGISHTLTMVSLAVLFMV